MVIAAILFLFLSGSPVQAASLEQVLTQAKQERWHEDLQWLRLGHYHKNFWGGYKSEADSDKFFLSLQGVSNPEQELEATIKEFFAGTKTIKSRDGKFEDPVACVFPARRMWIEKKSGHTFPAVHCDRYHRFLEILQPQSLTYVFSSYYLNNPASGFGHTFLRVNKSPSAKDGERYELADYGIGYAAVMISDNPLVYSILGVFGMMPGAFDINPYYFKVREYNDFESRDLWEYDLSFTPEEVNLIIAHVWELSDVNFDYYYFSENCSYRILSIFEVARPELHLVEQLKQQVMPADTVQLVARAQGLVKEVHYRPSVRATFQNRYETLSMSLKSRIGNFAKTESLDDLTANLETQEKKEVLDAAMDYLDFRYPQDILRKEGKYSFKKQILLARAETGGVSDTLKIATPYDEAPEKAYGSRRVSLGYRHWEKEDYTFLGAKLSLHDLLDPKIGYPPTAQITMGDFVGSWNSRTKEVALEKFTLFEVVSLAPIDDFAKSPSWRLRVSNDRGYENNCDKLCRWTELSGGIGVTKTLWKSLDIAAWARVTAQTSNDFTGDTWRAGAGPALMLRWNQGDFGLLAESYYRYDYKGEHHEIRQHTLGVQWTPTANLGLRVSGMNFNETDQFDTAILYYY